MTSHMPDPEPAHPEISDCSSENPVNQAPQQKGLPYYWQNGLQPAIGELELHVDWGRTEDAGPNPVGKPEQKGHGKWVCNPDQSNRYWQIHTKQNCSSCSQHHLKGDRHPCHQQPNPKGPCNRVAVKMPEISRVQQGAKDTEMLVLPYRFMVWHIPFNDMFWHIC